MSRNAHRKRSYRRRGAVVVLVAVIIPIIVAFTALTIDVGVMYSAKADLQRAADAAALAATARLGDSAQGDVLALARATAREFVQKNPVLRETVTIEDNDVVIGHAEVNPVTKAVTFTPTTVRPDAVRVTVRKTKASPNGQLPLYFAGIFGIRATDVQATATAALVPRDIAIVADLSRSHTYDTMLQHYRKTSVNLHDIWDKFPGGIGDADSTWGGDPSAMTDDELALKAGPAWGFFKQLGFGTRTIDANYDPNADPGLIRLASGANWTDQTLRAAIAARGYSAAEVSAIMSGAADSRGGYAPRVAVALGLADWNSGMPGGAWSTRSIGGTAGNNNSTVESSEIQWVERFGSRSLAESGQIWNDYITRYVSSSNSELSRANSTFRYQYGIKTFLDFLQSQRSSHEQTPELAGTPQQPMQAVKDAVSALTDTIYTLRGFDHMSLEIYGTSGRHEIDLTEDYASIADRLSAMQAGHYEPSTNMGAGMLRGIEELTSGRANPHARKVMFVLTDGYANIGCETCTRQDETAGRNYALDMARAAAAEGIQIFAISVGADSDTALMDEIARIGGGQHFHAEGSVDQYSAQLEKIFKALGGLRTVSLVE